MGASAINLSWVRNSNNESGFKIERSIDNVNFSQITVVSAGSLGYSDASVSANTTYYYRVRATNAIGDSAYTDTANATTSTGSGPVDLYHLDEGTGSTTADSADSNPGTLIGTTKPTWVLPGEIGPASLSFSGNGVYKATTSQSAVQTASSLAPVLGGTATLTAWIKTTQANTNSGPALWNAPAITGVEVAGSGNDIRWGYIDPTGHIGIGAGDTGFVSSSAINNGQWHHVAFTRNSTTGSCKFSSTACSRPRARAILG